AGKQPLQTIGAENGGKKFRAGIQAHCSKEERDPKFTKGKVGVRGHVPDLAADASNTPENQGHDEWSAGESKSDRVRQTGKRNRHRSEYDPENNANKEGNEMRFV